MRIVFDDDGWDDLAHWATTDRAMARRLIKLIEATARDPFAGIGKPEPLKHALAGCWSRRIDGEHRLVYRVLDDGTLVVLQARYHYG